MLDPLMAYFNTQIVKITAAIPAILSALILVIISLIIARLVRRGLMAALQRGKVDLQVTKMLSALAYWTIMIIGAVTALSQLGVNVSALVASLGIIGFTIGFALQDVGKNLVSGVLIVIQQPFNIGEKIEVSGFTGHVQEIGLRATEIKTLDGKIVTIPSAEVFAKPIINYSRATQRKVEIGIPVDYQNDLSRVQQLAVQSIEKQEGILPTPAPQVNFNLLSSETVQATLSYWVDPVKTDIDASRNAALLAVKEAFAREGILLPASED